MISPAIIDEIKIQLFNTAKCQLGQEWNYSNVISPFSRIYLISDGEGFITPNNKMHRLQPGYLYLVPSYTLCGYHCVDSMEQYYLHFAHHLPDGLKLFDQLSVVNQVKAQAIDKLLFERLLEINPGMNLRFSDPNVYKKIGLNTNHLHHLPNNIQLESAGIIMQLFSRFIRIDSKNILEHEQITFQKKIFQYITKHLYEEIRISELANIACCSDDHFTRRFKKITGMRPMEFINKKRIEKAQELLITTTLTQKRISDEVGFNSQQYYTRIFKKICGCTPIEYRKMGGLI